jgi:hypothetical protein
MPPDPGSPVSDLDALTLLQQLGLVVVPGPRLLPRILAYQLKKLRKKG